MSIRQQNGKPEIQQGFVHTLPELVTALESIDSRRWNAFFGCATFDPAKLADVEARNAKGERQPNGKPLKQRSHENAYAAQSFWLDIDAGLKKPYATAEQAIDALDDFVGRVGLPLPTVVESGNGVHAWWTLDQPIPAETWNRASAALKELTKMHGLHADPSRTADISSILRGPGTFNWKDDAHPKEVYCDELMPKISAQGFFLQLAGTAPVLPSKPSVDLGAALTNIPRPPSEPSYASTAVEHCKQLAHFRDTRGNIEEPLWYAGLGVLGHCADGEPLAHAWSNGHPQYSQHETQMKLEQARAASGPTTCGKFEDLNPDGCKGCPHRVSSPIVLGRGQTVTAPPVQTLGEERPVLPFGFKWGRNMELMTVPPKPKEGELEENPVVISPFALYLSGLRTSESRPDARGYVFQQWFPHEGWVQFELGAEELAGQGGRASMAKHGVLIAQPRWHSFLTYVHRAAVMLRGAGGDDTRYDQFGWKNNYQDFILGPVVYKCDGTRKLAAGSKELEIRARLMAPAPGGTLAAWTEMADTLFQLGCEAQGFALLASFAAPLMSYVSGDEGGAILSLYSARSGTGKTTALDAAASVWGELDALRLISSDTPVAKFRSIATLCNLPAVFEEMHTKDPTVIQEFVRNFTTGRDKKRAQRDGSVNQIENKWQTVLISASNQSLIDNLAFGGADPQAARVFELEMMLPPTIKVAASKAMRDAFMMNRGYAGMAYIEQLIKPATQEWIGAVMPKILAHYEQVIAGNTEHRFIVRLLACVAIAAHVVKKAGILHFDVERVMDWAIARASERVADRISFDPIASFKYILNENSQDCLVVADRYSAKIPTIVKKQPLRSLRMRYEMKPQRLYIAADTVRKMLTETNKPYGAVMRELLDQQILVRAGVLRSLGAGTDYISATVPCWEIDMGHPVMSGEMRLVETAALEAAHQLP